MRRNQRSRTHGGEGGPGYPSQDRVVGIRRKRRSTSYLKVFRGEEIIRLVERSHIGVRPTLAELGIPKTTFYRWYDRYLAFG